MSKIEYTLNGQTYVYDNEDLETFDGKITGEIIKEDKLGDTITIDTKVINSALENTLTDLKPIESYGENNE